MIQQTIILPYFYWYSISWAMTLLIQQPKYYYPPIDTATPMPWYLIQQPTLFSYNNWYSNLPLILVIPNPILLLSNWYNSNILLYITRYNNPTVMTLLIQQPKYHYTLIDTLSNMLSYSWHNKLLYLYTPIDTATLSYDTWNNNQYIITRQMIQ